MAIVVFVFHVFVYLVPTIVVAQPTDDQLSVREVSIGGFDIDSPPTESRDVPLPPIGVFEVTCKRSSEIVDSPWYYMNSSDVAESVEEITSGDLDTVNNGSVVQYRGSLSTTGWILRLTNAPDMYGMYECRTGSAILPINIIESNPGVLMSNNEYVTNTLDTSGLFMRIFSTGNPRPTLSDIDIYFDDQKLSSQDISDMGLYLSLLTLSAPTITTALGGRYTIVVSNEIGSANASFLVTVQTPPEIQVSISHDMVFVGESFHLNCTSISGFPVPAFKWKLNDVDLSSGLNGYVIEDYMDHSVLTVTSANTSNIGEYECEANNMVGSPVSADKNVYQVFLPSPIQIPVINLTSNHPLYTGVDTILNCTTLLSNPLYDLKNVNVTWTKDNEMIYIDNTPGSMREDIAHVSMLTIPYVSLSDSGIYTCSVTIYDDSVSSIAITSNQFTLEIENPPIDITVNPQATQVIAIPPYNSITLTCTASVPVTSAITHYKWYLNGSLLNDTEKITITDNEVSSQLTDNPSTFGILYYICEFTVAFLNNDPPLKKNATATVTVQAPVLPNVPVSSLPETLSYNTISIKFTIPSIAYDPEQYHIQYGTSSDNLNKISTTISGNTDLNTKNENFEIILNYLDHNTVYYYRIVANNSLGTVKTSVKTFQTPRIQLVQVKAGPFVGCDNGRVQYSTEVKTFLNEKLSERIREACDCSFPMSNLVNGSLYCSSEATSTLIYRVNVLPTTDITASEVVDHLERSLKSDQQFVSGVARVAVDISCNLSISSLVDPLCVSPTLETTPETCTDIEGIIIDSNVLVLSSVIGGSFIVLLLIAILVMGIMICYQHKRLRRIRIKRTSNQYSVVNCRRETSFMDHKPSPPAVAAPAPPSTQKWEGDVSISDCPAYLYSVKPLDNEPPQTIVERQPTPGIYDSIDGLNNQMSGFHVSHQLPSNNQHQSKINSEPIEDYTCSSDDVS